uniref:Uncharacterized protein n=1 Tax=Sphaerodactylus townsendi TaxID=933632 RepID=A0ACB8FFC9_9SAUR
MPCPTALQTQSGLGLQLGLSLAQQESWERRRESGLNLTDVVTSLPELTIEFPEIPRAALFNCKQHSDVIKNIFLLLPPADTITSSLASGLKRSLLRGPFQNWSEVVFWGGRGPN